MPVLTIRVTQEELSAADNAAQRLNLKRSEFARRALKAACQAGKKSGKNYPYGAWKGRISYKKAMKLLRA